MNLIQKIATALEGAENSRTANHPANRVRHRKHAWNLVDEFIPSGGDFTTLTLVTGASTSMKVMILCEFYTGADGDWISITITVTPTFTGFHVTLTARLPSDQAALDEGSSYLLDHLYNALSQEVDDTHVNPWVALGRGDKA